MHELVEQQTALEEAWSVLPRSLKALTISPSFLAWMLLLLDAQNWVAVLLIFLCGIPATFLYHVFSEFNIRILKYSPSLGIHVGFFTFQVVVYGSIMYFNATSFGGVA
jgi:hypothetical protein